VANFEVQLNNWISNFGLLKIKLIPMQRFWPLQGLMLSIS